MTTTLKADAVRRKALELGFDRVGITRAEPSPTLAAYERWIAAEMHAGMAYMARPDRVARRRDLNVILPGVQTLIVVALDYRTSVPSETLADPARGRIAAYAWGRDYHDIMLTRLKKLADWLVLESKGQCRAYVDTGALLERSHAQQAGLGFVGKNTMLIHPRFGSLFFIGEVLTTLPADACDAPFSPVSRCGTCTRCMQACPTDAFPEPHVLDARRCISYWTIEHKGSIPTDLRPLFGNWVFGCDICNDVCPFQRFAPLTHETAFVPARSDRAAPYLADLLTMSDDGFMRVFEGSPVLRIGRERLIRNACIAAGNWGDRSLTPVLSQLAVHANPVIREHAQWALNRCGD